MFTSGPFGVAIVAIICWAIVEVVNGPKRKKRPPAEQAEIEALQSQVNEMRERIQVLEKLVTDEKYSLNKEFENLRKGDAA